jgi:hypothetical protein
MLPTSSSFHSSGGAFLCVDKTLCKYSRSSNSKLLAIISLIVLASPVGLISLPSYAQPQPEEEDFFYSQDKKFPVTVRTDQIGVAAKDNVTRGQLQEFLLSNFGLKLIQEYPLGIFIFGLPSEVDRPAIANLSRTIVSEGAEFVAYAGFTATPQGAKTPLIVTTEFIAQFEQGVTDEQIASFNKDNGVEIVEPDPFVKNQFLLQVTEASPLDALDMANRYYESELTVFAHPNFVTVIDIRQFIPNDRLFGNQWHHQNSGLSGGTVDADVDTPLAWDITRGATGTIIAVIDTGFDMTHRDLVPNFWVNPGDLPGNGVDDDANGYVDDVNGYDFRGNDGDPAPDADTWREAHGTSVAGTAAARGNNALGVAGGCPNCSLMLIRVPQAVGQQAEAFGYAQQMGAQIITNSWGYMIGTPTTDAVVNAINNAATMGRGGRGAVVLFAMNNLNVNDCGANPDISSLPNVIAVSRSSNTDRFDLSGFGNCMDVLAPSWGGGAGTLAITTTDRQRNAGYNNNNPNPPNIGCPSTEPAPPPTDASDYTLCFVGTSTGTPLTAGIAGLILTMNPNLTRLQVQQLLQDTADKIEDSAGNYATNTGFSTPATHGWGRVNSFEALRIATPVAQGGLGGTDIFLRDNRLDWGNTEQPSNTLFEPTRGFIGHWQSEDIKVDAPPLQPAPITGADFESLVDETPSAVPGDVNKVYVRVHNRGPTTDPSVTVKLLWSQLGTALPSLPSDFWTAFPSDSSDTTQWHPLQCAGTTSSTCPITNLAYSGSSVATTAADRAQIAAFDFPAPSVNPGLSNHFCLLAMVDSTRDPISANSRSSFVVDDITSRDNNVSHRNYINLPTSRDRSFDEGFFVRNPTNKTVQAALRLEAPKDWKVELDKFDFNEAFRLKPEQEVLVSINITLPELNRESQVSIIQERIDGNKSIVMGGLTYQFSARQQIADFALHLQQ